ncbi:extracellular solute-binding protein [Acetobacter estunensis]|nr:extracellular solute-binding protein [Acetobacter estunensis]
MSRHASSDPAQPGGNRRRAGRRFRFTVRLAASLAIPLAVFGLGGHAAAGMRRSHAVVVASQPGALDGVLADVLWHPFYRLTHETIRMTTWNDQQDLSAERRADTPLQTWSLALVEEDTARIGCRDGVFRRMDEGHLDAKDDHACGLQAFDLDHVLVWDTKRLSIQPSWTDFWDVARHPGKRGLRADPRGTLEVALLSDGVPPNAIYSQLSTPQGLDRAFRRLSQLRPYIVWWNTPAEAMRILTTGAALMGMAPTTEVLAANTLVGERFGILWAPRLRIRYNWVEPAHPARNVVDAASLRTWIMAPEQTQALSKGLAESQAPTTETRPALALDIAFWTNHLDEISPRFAQWLARR